MRRYICLLVVLMFVVVVSGCETTQTKFENRKTRMVEGTAIGGAVGAVAGGVIGHQSGHTAGGALIGGAAGAVGGAILGSQIERQPQTTQPSTQVTMQQIVDLTKQGISSDEIISKIKAANSTYSLTADDLAYLRKEGVSERVIETMQAAK